MRLTVKQRLINRIRAELPFVPIDEVDDLALFLYLLSLCILPGFCMKISRRVAVGKGVVVIDRIAK